MTNPVTEGRALVKAIAGLLALSDAEVEFDPAERAKRDQLLGIYRNRLRRLIITASPEDANAILTGERDDIVDFNLN